MIIKLYRAMSKDEYNILTSKGFQTTFKAKDKFFVDDPKYIFDRIWCSKTFNNLNVKDNYAYLISVDVEFINGFKPKIIKHGNYNVIILRKSQLNKAYKIHNIKLISILSTKY